VCERERGERVSERCLSIHTHTQKSTVSVCVYVFILYMWCIYHNNMMRMIMNILNKPVDSAAYKLMIVCTQYDTVLLLYTLNCDHGQEPPRIPPLIRIKNEEFKRKYVKSRRDLTSQHKVKLLVSDERFSV